MAGFQGSKSSVSIQRYSVIILSYIRPKLKLSLFALYRPTQKYPADSKDFIGKKVLLFFLLVTAVHRITFYSISTEKIAGKLYETWKSMLFLDSYCVY